MFGSPKEFSEKKFLGPSKEFYGTILSPPKKLKRKMCSVLQRKLVKKMFNPLKKFSGKSAYSFKGI
jgi:hypothetical protein